LDSIESNYDAKSIPRSKVKVRKTEETDRRNLDTTENKGTTGYSNENQKQENEESSEIASNSQKLPGGEYDNSAYDLQSELDSIEANYDAKSIPWSKVKVRKTEETDQRPYRFLRMIREMERNLRT